jgi:hypothetical protein
MDEHGIDTNYSAWHRNPVAVVAGPRSLLVVEFSLILWRERATRKRKERDAHVSLELRAFRAGWKWATWLAACALSCVGMTGPRNARFASIQPSVSSYGESLVWADLAL